MAKRIQTTRIRWVVEVNDHVSGDAEPTVIGPYSEQGAEELVNWFAAQRQAGRIDPDWTATCYPLRREGRTWLLEEFGPQEAEATVQW